MPTAAARCGTVTTADRGGMSRECGFPAWRLFGLEYFSLLGVGTPGVGPYKVRNPDHFLFRTADDLKLREGESFADTPGRSVPQPIGHEADVRVSTIAKFLVETPPRGRVATRRRSGRNHAPGRGIRRRPEDRFRLGLLSAPAAAGQGTGRSTSPPR